MYQEEQFSEIIFLNLGQWFRRCCLKISYLELWWPSCSVEGTIYAILKEGIMGNIHVKLYEIRTSGSGGDVVKRKSLRTNARQIPLFVV